jgi:glutamine amidotransferase-like uncharacterized protein
VIQTQRFDQSVAGPLFSQFTYTWNLGAPTAPLSTHMPEPSTAAMLLLGGGAAALIRYRR